MTVVRKILESTLTAGSTSLSFTDSLIPNSILKVTTTNTAVFPTSQSVTGNTLQLTFTAQSSNIGVSLEIIKQGLDIVDDLLSTDSDKALSAKQGYMLKGLIDNIPAPVTTLGGLEDVTLTSPTLGQFLMFTDNDVWENVTIPEAESEDF